MYASVIADIFGRKGRLTCNKISDFECLMGRDTEEIFVAKA